MVVENVEISWLLGRSIAGKHFKTTIKNISSFFFNFNSFSWVGVEQAESIFLNDFGFSKIFWRVMLFT